MSLVKDHCWVTHKRRQAWHVCPLCGASLKWVRAGDEWSPCDELPVLYIKGRGKLQIVSHGELIEGCSLYEPRRCLGKTPVMGRLPHYYSCLELKRRRREWAISRKWEKA